MRLTFAKALLLVAAAQPYIPGSFAVPLSNKTPSSNLEPYKPVSAVNEPALLTIDNLLASTHAATEDTVSKRNAAWLLAARDPNPPKTQPAKDKGAKDKDAKDKDAKGNDTKAKGKQSAKKDSLVADLKKCKAIRSLVKRKDIEADSECLTDNNKKTYIEHYHKTEAQIAAGGHDRTDKPTEKLKNYVTKNSKGVALTDEDEATIKHLTGIDANYKFSTDSSAWADIKTMSTGENSRHPVLYSKIGKNKDGVLAVICKERFAIKDANRYKLGQDGEGKADTLLDKATRDKKSLPVSELIFEQMKESGMYTGNEKAIVFVASEVGNLVTLDTIIKAHEAVNAPDNKVSLWHPQNQAQKQWYELLSGTVNINPFRYLVSDHPTIVKHFRINQLGTTPFDADPDTDLPLVPAMYLQLLTN
ncbi:uncharacterized protein K452DRAFT_302719 [Aplosporella prunicola CBS 121167]|uniref:Uncharacterized protein n=1 Tax=Aplosporella prunicola CBS 121167 TaxID=1176127 RepID=A0A6A6AZX6_9PEZI|nr:uncharacterized protein K452DRAFT_302719 [Aplosporella prunicola CBS 121167]KAF2136515.1 hypothetical protein K452DRAFT_302719 [Aplosporella prunicola CBS 121167]